MFLCCFSCLPFHFDGEAIHVNRPSNMSGNDCPALSNKKVDIGAPGSRVLKPRVAIVTARYSHWMQVDSLYYNR